MGPKELEVMVSREVRGWVVRVVGAETMQTFACATEEMALKFATVIEQAVSAVL